MCRTNASVAWSFGIGPFDSNTTDLEFWVGAVHCGGIHTSKCTYFVCGEYVVGISCKFWLDILFHSNFFLGRRSRRIHLRFYDSRNYTHVHLHRLCGFSSTQCIQSPYFLGYVSTFLPAETNARTSWRLLGIGTAFFGSSCKYIPQCLFYHGWHSFPVGTSN